MGSETKRIEGLDPAGMSRYFFDLFERLPRVGPGNIESTLKAYNMMAGIPERPLLLDIGCGPGGQTLDLARATDARITAFDLHPPFVEKLRSALEREGFQDRVRAVQGDMFKLVEEYGEASFDIVWSEGALYFMGFENGFNECFKVLRPGGYIAVSDGCWLEDGVPEEAKGFWGEGPDATGIPDHLQVIEKTGFEVVGHFTVPFEAWIADFYGPMEKELDLLEKENASIPEAMDVYASMRKEIEQIRKFNRWAGYEFFVARKP
jgi:SAM-dependent methyltransferase